ncbi:MAG TPA: 4-hydroxy-3-methylbut-2-en-1-yl diphosphate synthase [Lentisphaeria bacterium]|nr:MAG: 4-hydroxy-3-methylbut-2-en-1-yl diphosphate synthase [Lentisphaerae bacterium GWF2_38_69]HBM17483.1 4-hydroxy-3-methylbut-2-en-1-yl diphosphate synthase [Lentisphaeria bacterium]
MRRKTRNIKIGNIGIGSDYPVSIQSMTNSDTRNVKETLSQISELAKLGCQIARVAVPDIASANAIKIIIQESLLPIVADIHFDYKLALISIQNGVHAVRINPGNIGAIENVKAVAEAAGEAGIPIRIGANTGSLPKEFHITKNISSKFKKAELLADALIKSALKQCEILEGFNFKDIKVSLKASDALTTYLAYRNFASITNYPLHLGVTEAGTLFSSSVKSSIGIGSLLINGIGDTIRVSVTGSPLEEIKIARAILEAAGNREPSPEIVSCPTCARTTADIIDLTKNVESLIASMKSDGYCFSPFKIAIMGCAVNGPGEARDADIGIAGADGRFVLFRNGQTVKNSYSEAEAFSLLKEEILRRKI